MLATGQPPHHELLRVRPEGYRCPRPDLGADRAEECIARRGLDFPVEVHRLPQGCAEVLAFDEERLSVHKEA